MRSILTIVVISCIGASSALAQQQPCPKQNIFGAMAGPAAAAQYDFEHAVCEYRNCLAAPRSGIAERGLTPEQHCEGLKNIMDASAVAAGHYNGSR